VLTHHVEIFITLRVRYKRHPRVNEVIALVGDRIVSHLFLVG